jgi:hypothetical protein
LQSDLSDGLNQADRVIAWPLADPVWASGLWKSAALVVSIRAMSAAGLCRIDCAIF